MTNGFHDCFHGKYIIVHEDGVPVADGDVASDGRPFTKKATHPSKVRLFLTLDDAKRFRNQYVVAGSVHRVEGLNVLHEKFSW
jgi:hypothetical protein